MARARLHLICGNCGCNDEWKWEYVPQDAEVPDTGPAVAPATHPAVYLWCGNCATLHDINDNAEIKGI